MTAESRDLQDDVEALIVSLREDWRIVGDDHLAPSTREGERTHIYWCLEELSGLAGSIDVSAPEASTMFVPGHGQVIPRAK